MLTTVLDLHPGLVTILALHLGLAGILMASGRLVGALCAPCHFHSGTGVVLSKLWVNLGRRVTEPLN